MSPWTTITNLRRIRANFTTKELPRATSSRRYSISLDVTLELRKQTADFSRAEAHYYPTNTHFSRSTPTFHNRGAHILFAGEQYSFAGAHSLPDNAPFHHDGVDFGCERSEFERALCHYRKAASNCPFLILEKHAVDAD